MNYNLFLDAVKKHKLNNAELFKLYKYSEKLMNNVFINDYLFTNSCLYNNIYVPILKINNVNLTYCKINNVFKTPEEESLKEVKEVYIVYYNSNGVDYQQKTRYYQLATECYSENAIVNICIDLISNNTSRVAIALFRGDQFVLSHQLFYFLYNPNPYKE